MMTAANPRCATGLSCRVAGAMQLTPEEIGAWEGLCARYPHLENPFFSPHYCRAVAAVRPNVYVAVIRYQGVLTAFLPFQFRTAVHKMAGAAERVGEEMTDYFGIIAEPDLRLNHEALLRLSRLQYLGFTHLDETQAQYGLTGEQPEPGFIIRLDGPVPYWEELRRGSHKDFAKETQRGERQLEAKCGPLRFCASEPNWRPVLDELMRFKGLQYARSGRPNIFASPWKRSLMATLAETREPSCTGVLSTLYAGDTWLGSHFGLRSGGILHYWFPVYNPELARYGPGRVFLKALIERAPELGIHTIDCGAGVALYKQQCCNHTHTYFRGTWHRMGIRALAVRAADSARWRLENWRMESRKAT